MASALDDFIGQQIFGKGFQKQRTKRETDEAERALQQLITEFPTEIAQPVNQGRGFDPSPVEDFLDPATTREEFAGRRGGEIVPTRQSREFGKRGRNLLSAEDRLSEILAPAPKAKQKITKGNRNLIITENGKEVLPRIKLDKPFKRGDGVSQTTPSKILKRISAIEQTKVKIEAGQDIDPIALSLIGDNPDILKALNSGDKTKAIKALDRERDFLESKLPPDIRKRQKSNDPLGIR